MKFKICLFSLLILTFHSCGNNDSVKTITLVKPAIDTNGTSLSAINSLHKRKSFKTYDPTLVQYANSKPNRPDAYHTAIYLLPLGDMSPEIEKIITEEIPYLQAFFQLPVKIMPRIPFTDLKKIAQVKTRMISEVPYGYEGKMKEYGANKTEQIECNSLIEHYIAPNKPKDAVVVLGITDHDMYTDKYNFLYGLSHLKDGAGLISTHRLQNVDEYTKWVIRKAMSKQIANLFSIKNVKDYECLLNFHNTVEESYTSTFHISPRALEKLKLGIGFDYQKRFTELRDFWIRDSMPEQSDYYKTCLDLVSPYN